MIRNTYERCFLKQRNEYNRCSIPFPSSRNKIRLLKNDYKHLKSQVIRQSDPIPFGPVLIKRSLSEDLKSNIRRALYDMHENAPSTFQAVLEAWIEASGAVRYKEGQETDYTFLLSDD